MQKHFPVMLQECIESLRIKPEGIYIDLTLGRAGHSIEILNKLTTGKLIAFDKDKQAIKEGGINLKKVNNNFLLIHSDFNLLKSELDKLKIKAVDGIIADLGVSSPQLDESYRGFSYRQDGRLDMRMNQDQNLDAHMVVNQYSEEDLVTIFRNYADVKLPRRVAKGIISNRPIDTTLKLVEIIKQSLPHAIVRKKNPAKSVFQALRIEVNRELDSLSEMLNDAIGLLKPKASLVILTFHSIEDRIVKRKFGSYIKDDSGKLPIIVKKQYEAKTKKPSLAELKKNKRSHSAKLRVLTYLGD